MSTNAPLHVLELEIQNVRKIRALTITPNGAPVEIAGKNEAGKSTVLDCIIAAASTGLTDDMITVGEKAAGIVVKTEHYSIRHKKTRGQPSRLELLGPAGEKFPSPRAATEALCAPTSFAFDLGAFERMSDRDLDTLLRTVGGVDTTALDTDRARVFADRTQVGRDHKQALTLLGPVVEAPDDEISVDALLEDQRAAQAQIAENEKQRTALANSRTTVGRLDGEIVGIEEKIATWQAAVRLKREERDALAAKITEHGPTIEALTDPDLTTIAAQIREASTTNAAVAAKRQRATRETAAGALADQYDALTTQLADLDAQKGAALAGATFPVDGLTLTEDGIYYHGAPVSQASRSAKRRLAFALNVALKPRLAVALIHDASLLDAASKADVLALCVEHNVQPWFETVGAGSDGAIVIEEGAVVGADLPAGEAVEA